MKHQYPSRFILDNSSHLGALQAEIDTLRAEVERVTKQSSDRLIGLCKTGDDNDKLRAELVEYQNTKPVAWRAKIADESMHSGFCYHFATHPSTYHDCEQIELFTHPPKEKTE